VQEKARSGEVDVLIAAYKTTAREEYMSYSIAYVTDPLVLFVKRGKEFSFAKNEDLIGKNGVGTDGDSYGQEFDDYIKTHLKFVRTPTAKEALDLIESGQADYFIYSLYSGHEELKTNAREEQFTTLPHFVAQEPFYVTISKKSPYLKYLPDINRLIEKYKADGTIDQLMVKYKKQFQIE
jgi:polar amino acid transport system substrate-binding protein